MSPWGNAHMRGVIQEHWWHAACRLSQDAAELTGGALYYLPLLAGPESEVDLSVRIPRVFRPTCTVVRSLQYQVLRPMNEFPPPHGRPTHLRAGGAAGPTADQSRTTVTVEANKAKQ
jgi:hypothetical protein